MTKFKRSIILSVDEGVEPLKHSRTGRLFGNQFVSFFHVLISYYVTEAGRKFTSTQRPAGGDC